MSCRMCGHDGKCQMVAYDSDTDLVIAESLMFRMGCEEDGICVVEDDPSPEDSCDSYESNSYEDEEE